MSEACRQVVVNGPGCLQMGVHSGAAHKFEAAFFKVFAEAVGKRGSSRNFIEALPIVLDRLAIHKGPDIGIKAAKFVLNVNKLLRVVNGGTNFKLVANNRRIDRKSVV